MNKLIVGGVIALLLTNYATFWATDKVSQIEVLEERVDKYEQAVAQAPQEGPSK